jgi:hypothetical protein
MIPPTITRTNVKPQPKLTHVFSQPNLTNFKNALSNLTWNDVITLNNVDSCFDVFWDSFNTLYELHFPLTKVTFNKNIHGKNEFMTAALLISRRHKLELHKKSLIDPHNF